MDPGTIEVGTTLSGTAAVTPVIQNKTASVSGKTQITASPTTSTTGISTYYMAVETPENLNPLMANPYIETNGYGTSDHFISSSDSTVAGANGSGTYYIPLATGGVSTSGGGLSKGTASGGGLSGGGLTGVAAAVSAAREGLKVLLIERSGSLGGAINNNLVYPFMVYWTDMPEDNSKKYLSAGLFAEMRDREKKYDNTNQLLL